MKTIKGPAIFLAQFAGDAAPFNDLSAIARWAAGRGYRVVLQDRRKQGGHVCFVAALHRLRWVVKETMRRDSLIAALYRT